MKREAKLLLHKSLDSLVLAVEHFNRPWDRGRTEATLILLDRGFELLMKSSLVHREVGIRESPSTNTYGFEKCVNLCVSKASPAILSEEDAITARLINGMRDGAQHYLIELSEQQLYVYVQAGVTLFSDKLEQVFGQKLSDHFPERVLPVSTKPPGDLESVVRAEFAEIKRLVAPGSRQGLTAKSRLRALAILENSLAGDSTQPTSRDLDRLIRRIRKGERWKRLFPGVAKLELSSEGTGLNVSIRLTKASGEAVRLVRDGAEGSEDAAVVAVKRVNELGYYSLGLNSVAEKLSLTAPKALALIRHLHVQDNSDYFKEFRIGASSHKRYSPKALELLKKTLPTIDMDEVWRLNHPSRRASVGAS